MNINIVDENYKMLLNSNYTNNHLTKIGLRVHMHLATGVPKKSGGRRLQISAVAVFCFLCITVPSPLGPGSSSLELIYFALLLGWSRVSASCVELKRSLGSDYFSNTLSQNSCFCHIFTPNLLPVPAPSRAPGV